MEERNNVRPEIDIIINNIPEDLEPIEKVRWIYLKLGNLFTYNLKILIDYYESIKPLNFNPYENMDISKYQTCVQISEIFSKIINNLNIQGLSAKVIELKLKNKAYAQEHQAVEVVYGAEKYRMDLTLDLYLIQSEFQTKNFGYTTDEKNTYDIIPLSMTRKMDQKCGITLDKENNLKHMKEAYETIKFSSKKEKLQSLLISIQNKLLVTFNGQHEGLRFLNDVLNELLDKDMYFKNYNLYYNEQKFDFTTCFLFKIEDEILLYLYDRNVGLIETNKEKLLIMLNNNWKTNSNTLINQLDSLDNSYSTLS